MFLLVTAARNTNAQAGLEIGEKVRAAIEHHTFEYEGKRMPVTTSMGVAELRADIESPNTLLKMADKALYSAKQTGRNRVVVAT
jgi:two-component system cell cycle response regulator